jgi:hypothetical protein
MGPEDRWKVHFVVPGGKVSIRIFIILYGHSNILLHLITINIYINLFVEYHTHIVCKPSYVFLY